MGAHSVQALVLHADVYGVQRTHDSAWGCNEYSHCIDCLWFVPLPRHATIGRCLPEALPSLALYKSERLGLGWCSLA